MAPGFAAETGDWRYTMVMPDGSVFGTTKGEGSERVEFCGSCHALAGDGGITCSSSRRTYDFVLAPTTE